MYNVAPHGTTEKAPSKLLLNRVIRDKIPSIVDIEKKDYNLKVSEKDLIN